MASKKLAYTCKACTADFDSFNAIANKAAACPVCASTDIARNLDTCDYCGHYRLVVDGKYLNCGALQQTTRFMCKECLHRREVELLMSFLKISIGSN